jgi:hypothetical protein
MNLILSLHLNQDKDHLFLRWICNPKNFFGLVDFQSLCRGERYPRGPLRA